MSSRILIPAGVLALGGIVWIVGQRREIVLIRQEVAVLEERLAAVSPLIVGGEIRRAGMPAELSTDELVSGAGIGWEKAQKIGSGMMSMADRVEFREKIDRMSADEIVAALDELETTDLTPEGKAAVIRQFVDRLISLDPRLALERFAKFADSDHTVADKLAKAIGTWLRQDPAAALVWLDGWVAGNPIYESALSRISPGRIRFETEVIRAFLEVDPDMIAKRISAMPREEAVALLTRFTWIGPAEGAQAAFANVVRESLPPEDGIGILANKAELLAKTSLDDAAAFLDRIQPTPGELETCIKAAVGARMGSEPAGQDLASEIQRVREWVAVRDAAQIEPLTGVAFGHALNGRHLDFEEVALMVLQFHAGAGNDEVLRAFLTHGGCCHGNQSLKLAEKIADRATRQEVIRHIENHP